MGNRAPPVQRACAGEPAGGLEGWARVGSLIYTHGDLQRRWSPIAGAVTKLGVRKCRHHGPQGCWLGEAGEGSPLLAPQPLTRADTPSPVFVGQPEPTGLLPGPPAGDWHLPRLPQTQSSLLPRRHPSRHTSLSRGPPSPASPWQGPRRRAGGLHAMSVAPTLVRLSWPAVPSVDQQLHKELRGLLAGPKDTVQVQPPLQTPRKREDEELPLGNPSEC